MTRICDIYVFLGDNLEIKEIGRLIYTLQKKIQKERKNNER
jgi:hypothetical protein